MGKIQFEVHKLFNKVDSQRIPIQLKAYVKKLDRYPADLVKIEMALKLRIKRAVIESRIPTIPLNWYPVGFFYEVHHPDPKLWTLMDTTDMTKFKDVSNVMWLFAHKLIPDVLSGDTWEKDRFLHPVERKPYLIDDDVYHKPFYSVSFVPDKKSYVVVIIKPIAEMQYGVNLLKT